MSNGKWERVRDDSGRILNTEVVAVHLALLKTGKLLMFNGDHRDFNDLNRGLSRTWNPATNELTKQTLKRNLFCAGHCFLPDGRLLVAGGQSWVGASPPWVSEPIFGRGADLDVHTFDPERETWTRHKNMDDNRWYPTCTTLPNGNALIVSGYKAKLRKNVNETSETFHFTSSRLSQPRRFHDDVGLYPFVHVLPGGLLFVHSRDTTRLFDQERERWLSHEFETVPVGSGGRRGTHTYDGTGGCVLLPIDDSGDDVNEDVVRILLVGGSTGREPDSDSPATDVAQIFEYDRNDPGNSRWRATDRLNNRRFMSDATLLPDGTVFVSNGASRGNQGDSSDAVVEGEMFDPVEEKWEPMAEAPTERLYHSTALLLPDRRVVVAGSTGHHWPADGNEFTLDVFSPPYCDEPPVETPALARRVIPHDGTLRIRTRDPQSIERVVLVRASSVTHTVNMDQRLVDLSIQERRSDAVVVRTPKDRWIAPPGPYMLFLVDAAGRVSEGQFVDLFPAFPGLHVDPSSVSFPRVPVGEVRDKPVSITNFTDADVTVTVPEPPDPPTGPGAPGLPTFSWHPTGDHPLRRGDQKDVLVTFSPAGEGRARTTLELTSTDPESPYRIALSGTTPGGGGGGGPDPDDPEPEPKLHVRPASLSFGPVAVGDVRTAPVTIENNTGSSVTISVPDSPSPPTGPGAPGLATFSWAPTGDTLLARNDEMDVLVTFSPAASGRARTTLTLTSTDPDSPHQIPLTGRGLGGGGGGGGSDPDDPDPHPK